MRIIFVRHGHPNYKNDCLTELGHKHAKAVAERLSEEKLDRVYSSTCGRAVETAQYIADDHNMSVESFDFMCELSWNEEGGKTPHNGHPWRIVKDMIASGDCLVKEDWQNTGAFQNSRFVLEAVRVGKAFDDFLENLGYKREGDFYRITKNSSENVVMVSHAGSSSAVFSHLFNLPAPFVFGSMLLDYTGVTIVSFDGEDGSLISPKFEIVNDARHIANYKVENVFGN